MTQAFCTITTYDHLPQVLALFKSVSSIQKDVLLKVLVVDKNDMEMSVDPNVEFYFKRHLKDYHIGNAMIEKYEYETDKLRWTLKPVFISYLLEEKGINRVLYVDNDIFFYGDFQFLFERLANYDIILIPHWRVNDPEIDEAVFKTYFKDGIYNAGFIGANKSAVQAMKWWAKCCLYKCERNFAEGLYDDQKYLDLLPVLFEKTNVLRHQGCNVAYWNQYECKRTSRNGEVRINEKWPVIFIHFTQLLINDINSGKDGLLKPHLEEYQSTVASYRQELAIS